MPNNTLLTVRDFLRYAVSRFQKAGLFFGHGSSHAYDEAAYLILHTLSLPLDTLEPFLDAKLLNNEKIELISIIEKRATERVPAAYITNEAWLGRYAFYIDERALIPRSFIQELIPTGFAPWIKDPDQVTQVLELCTGSGCLAVMLADVFQYAEIDATDLSADALDVAQINLDRYDMEEQVMLFESDLYEALPPKQYDLIVTNPPYVNTQSMHNLPDEYLKEPEMALAGGEDGMDLVRKIVGEAADWLTEDGVLVVEIGNEYEHAMAAFMDLELTWLTTSGGDDRVFLLTKAQLNNTLSRAHIH